MNQIERRIGPHSLTRLLDGWRPPDGRHLAHAVADRIRLLVLDGRLPLRTRLPAERELAVALQVSRTTVAAAYDILRAADLLHSRRGAGSWTMLPAGSVHDAPPAPFAPSGDGSLFDLAHAALPAPTDAMRRAAAAAVHDLDAYLGGHGYDLLGLPVLRRAIAGRFTERGLPTGADQVLVTAGGVHALMLALTALTGPGDRVLVEHPTYPNALGAITTRGARPVPVPLGRAPVWDLDLFTAAVRDAAPRAAYVIPDFQNPTGAVLDPAGRARLVDLARRTGTPLLVDETLCELALDEPAPRPVASFGAADSPLVLTIGSASKVFWGGLRLGWIRSSAAMVRRLAALRTAIDLGGPLLEQLVVTRLLGELDDLVAARRPQIVADRNHLAERLAVLFPQWRAARPPGGLSLWVDLDEPASSRLTVAARRHDVLLAAGPRFGVDGAFERSLRLPYTLDRARTDAALARIVTAWRGLDPGNAALDPDPAAVA